MQDVPRKARAPATAAVSAMTTVRNSRTVHLGSRRRARRDRPARAARRRLASGSATRTQQPPLLPTLYVTNDGRRHEQLRLDLARLPGSPPSCRGDTDQVFCAPVVIGMRARRSARGPMSRPRIPTGSLRRWTDLGGLRAHPVSRSSAQAHAFAVNQISHGPAQVACADTWTYEEFMVACLPREAVALFPARKSPEEFGHACGPGRRRGRRWQLRFRSGRGSRGAVRCRSAPGRSRRGSHRRSRAREA